MQVSIIGTGYVGLVSGVCFAEKGHQVLCVDIDQSKVDKINQGISPFYEPGLNELLEQNIHARLKATTDFRQAILDTELSLIAVGTPFDGREVDLTYVKQAAQQIGEAL
ncbi:MAG TPA: 3-hydroxyacyl-CoA dehydrogenase NAD-binding domain-containing protein, partial [Leptolyngbya sp.]|nr:3-hydroxyacyl-CoA dehydrogenase NAD-binding domain-containing protein [Leptolyngbya sp.]